jgi:hypothetical protein
MHETKIFIAFLEIWLSHFKPNSTLMVNQPDPDITINYETNVTSIESKDEVDKVSVFDLIIGNAIKWEIKATSYRREYYECRGQTYLINKPWKEIFDCLTLLAENGVAIFLVNPDLGPWLIEKDLENCLNSEGIYFSAIIGISERNSNYNFEILSPLHPRVLSTIVIITRKRPEKLFLAVLCDESKTLEIFSSYVSCSSGSDLLSGLFIFPKYFVNLNYHRIEMQINRYAEQNQNFSKFKIKDISQKINDGSSGKKLFEIENSIYLQRRGYPLIGCFQNDHRDLFQLVLQENVEKDYLTIFFRSALARYFNDFIYSGEPLRKRDVENMLVVLPKLEEQKFILETSNKISKLLTYLDEFNYELLIIPANVRRIENQLDEMLDAIKVATEEDKVKKMIAAGETKLVEFKASLSLNFHQKEKGRQKDIEENSLKEIVAFLNTDGGTLLIGVENDGTLVGIDEEINEIHKSVDRFELQLGNIISDRIGPEIHQFIDWNILSIDGSSVCKCECKKSPDPCYLDGEHFYYRTGPRAQKLKGQSVHRYIKNHFNGG